MPRDIEKEISDFADKVVGKMTRARTEASTAAHRQDLENLKEMRKAYGDLSDEERKVFDEAFGKLTRNVKSAKKLTNQYESAVRQVEKYRDSMPGARTLAGLTKSISQAEDEMAKLARATDDVSKARKIELEVDAATLAQVRELAGHLDEAEKKKLDEVISSEGVDDVKSLLGALADLNPQLAEAAEKARVAAIENVAAAESTGSFADEVDRAAQSLGPFAEHASRGADEAKGFAGGLGESSAGITAVGVAAVFAANKVGEMASQMRDSTLQFAKFRVELDAVARQAVLPGGAERLEVIRQELNLSTDEFAAFTSIIVDGSNIGVASLDQLSEAASALTETFGGDQTERLAKYVELLKAIPTIEEDLTLTASVDDRTATLFALAEQGEIQTVIDLQAAGLLGGIEIEGGRDADIANSAKAMDQTLENMDMMMADFFGEMVPLISGGVDVLAKIMAAGGGVVSTLFGVRAIMSTLHREQKDTTRSVLHVEDEQRDTTDAINDLRREMKGGGGPAGRGRGRRGAQARVLGAAQKFKAGAKGAFTAPTLGAAFTGGGAGGATAAGGAAATVLAPLAVGAAAFGATALAIERYGDDVGDALINVADRSEGASKAFKVLFPVLAATGTDLRDLGEHLKAASGWYRVQIDALKASIGIGEHANRLSGQEAELLMSRIDAFKGEMRQRRQQQRNALALQKSLNLVKRAADNAKVALADLDREVAKMELERFEQVGGTMTDFESAIRRGVGGVNENFRIMREGFEDARDFIERNSAMDAATRRAALTRLSKEELAAESAYVEGLLDLTGNLDKIPGVIEANLGIAIRDARLDFEMAAPGGMFGAFEDRAANLVDSFGALTDQVGRLNDEAATAISVQEGLAEASASSAEGIASRMDSLGDAAEGLEGVFVAREGEPIEVTDVEGLEDFRAKRQAEVDRLQREIADVGFGVTTADIEAAAKNVQDASREVEQMNAGLTGANAALNDARQKSKGLSGVIKDTFGFDREVSDQLDEGKDITQGMALAKRDMLEAEKSVTSATEKRRIALEEQRRIEDELVGIGEKIVGSEAETVEERKKAIAAAKKAITAADEERSALEKRLLQSEEAVRLAEDLGNEAERGVATQRGTVKTLEQFSEQVKAVFSQLENLTQLIESDPYVKLLTARAERAQAEQELAIAIGDTQGRVVEAERRRRDQLEEQLDVAGRTLDFLEQMGDNAGEMGEFLERTSEEFGEAVDEALNSLTGTAPIAGIEASANEAKAAFDDFVKLYQEGAPEEAIKDAANRYQDAQRRFSASVEEGTAQLEDAGDEEAAAALQAFADNVSTMGSAVGAATGGVETATENVRAEMARLELEMRKINDSISDFLDTIDSRPIVRAAQAQSQLADGLLELAEFAGGLDSAFSIASQSIAAARREYDETAVALAQSTADLAEKERILAEDRAEFNRQLKDGEIAGKEAAAKRNALAADAVSLERQRTEVAARGAEAQLKLQKQIGDVIKRARDLQVESFQIRQDIVEEEISFLSDIGAPFETIFDLTRQTVALEAEKLAISRQALETRMREDPLYRGSLEAQRDIKDLRVAELGLQKKIVGAQRDAMEKLLGAAFGELADQAGRRFVMSEQRLLGVEQTRFQTRAGRLTGVAEGEGGTISDRAAMLGLSAAFGGAGGVTGAGAPQRTKFEKEVADELAAGADANKINAEQQAKANDIAGETLDVQKASFGTLEAILSTMRTGEASAPRIGKEVQKNGAEDGAKDAADNQKRAADNQKRAADDQKRAAKEEKKVVEREERMARDERVQMVRRETEFRSARIGRGQFSVEAGQERLGRGFRIGTGEFSVEAGQARLGAPIGSMQRREAASPEELSRQRGVAARRRLMTAGTPALRRMRDEATRERRERAQRVEIMRNMEIDASVRQLSAEQEMNEALSPGLLSMRSETAPPVGRAPVSDLPATGAGAGPEMTVHVVVGGNVGLSGDLEGKIQAGVKAGFSDPANIRTVQQKGNFVASSV